MFYCFSSPFFVCVSMYHVWMRARVCVVVCLGWNCAEFLFFCARILLCRVFAGPYSLPFWWSKKQQVGFKMFLGTVATCTNWATDAQGNATECSLILDDIPFVDYVELPPSLSELRYSNILCGVIKGALEQVRTPTTTTTTTTTTTSHSS